MNAAIHTNDRLVAEAIATPYQRGLLEQLQTGLEETSDFTWPEGEDGPLELKVGERTLTLPARPPDMVELMREIQGNPYARAWGRLYAELVPELGPGIEPLTGAIADFIRSRMDGIIAEELGMVDKPAPGQLTIGHHEGGRRDVEGHQDAANVCGACGNPGGHHTDSCNSPAARQARGLPPIRLAPGRRP